MRGVMQVVFIPVAVVAQRYTAVGFELICFLVASSLLAQVVICVP